MTLLLKHVWNTFFDSLLLLNQNGIILDLNRSAARLFSMSPQTIIGSSVFELISSEELKKSLSSGKSQTGIPVSLGPQQLVANLSRLDQEGSCCYLAVLKNITQIQQLQHQIQELNGIIQRFDLILDQLEEGVTVIDEHGKILFYNRKMGEVDMLEPETVRHRRLQDVWNLDETNSTLLTALRTGRSLSQRETHYTTNGKAVTTLNRTVPLCLGEQRVGAMEICKDISEQKHLTETIMQLQKQAPAKSAVPSSAHAQNNTRFQFSSIIYSSREMRQTVEQARRAARSSSNILIVGETGTGKELFAQSIHNESPRKNKPFIAQNCAALPETLLEGLLFGTTVGSFTGAIDRAGLFEQAHGGTLLLDEINSMGIELQAKLLRALQERKVQRLGSAKTVDIDVRVIATMNEDPLEAIANGRLREDLYYRLGVVNLVIPPLRKRRDDIPILIRHFIEKHAKILDMEVEGVEPDVFELFMNDPWPGNVRQLEHVIEGCLNLMYDEKRIGFEHLPAHFKQKLLHPPSPPTGEQAFQKLTSLPEQVEKLERTLIERAMKEAAGNITKAGEMLGLSRQNLKYKLKKYNIFR